MFFDIFTRTHLCCYVFGFLLMFLADAAKMTTDSEKWNMTAKTCENVLRNYTLLNTGVLKMSAQSLAQFLSTFERILWSFFTIWQKITRIQHRWKMYNTSSICAVGSEFINSSHVRCTWYCHGQAPRSLEEYCGQITLDVDCWDRGALHEHDEYLMVLGINKHEFNLMREQTRVY
jgi:hypothetical protein